MSEFFFFNLNVWFSSRETGRVDNGSKATHAVKILTGHKHGYIIRNRSKWSIFKCLLFA